MKKYINPEVDMILFSKEEYIQTVVSLSTTYSGFGVEGAEGVWTW